MGIRSAGEGGSPWDVKPEGQPRGCPFALNAMAISLTYVVNKPDPFFDSGRGEVAYRLVSAKNLNDKEILQCFKVK